MNNLRFFHTFWTKPMRESRITVNMLIFALSYTYARKMGAQIVLHTDQLGKQILKDIPYDEVYTDLEHINSNINKFWAYGKLYATSQEPLGAIHIDGDVFLKNPKLKELFTQQHDLLTQSEEDDKWRLDQTYTLSQQVITQQNLPDYLHINYPNAYNCGVVQFKNQELKDRYLKSYFEIVDKSIKDPTFHERYNYFQTYYQQHGAVIPDIVAEQQILHELAQNYKTATILKGDIYEDAKNKGYIHYLTTVKYQKQEYFTLWLNKINPRLLHSLRHNKYFKQ